MKRWSRRRKGQGWGTLLLLAGVGCWVRPAAGLEPISISATPKTGYSRKSATQALPRGNTSWSEKSKYYRFDFKANTTDLAAPLTVEWGILLEKADGRLRLGGHGREALELKFGQTVSIESDPVELRSRTWHQVRGSGELEDRIAGYGVRITDPSGRVVAEKFDPTSIQSEFERLINSAGRSREESPPSERPRFRERRKHPRRDWPAHPGNRLPQE